MQTGQDKAKGGQPADGQQQPQPAFAGDAGDGAENAGQAEVSTPAQSRRAAGMSQMSMASQPRRSKCECRQAWRSGTAACQAQKTATSHSTRIMWRTRFMIWPGREREREPDWGWPWRAGIASSAGRR